MRLSLGTSAVRLPDSASRSKPATTPVEVYKADIDELLNSLMLASVKYS